MVAKLFVYKLMKFRYLKLEFLFFVFSTAVEIISIYIFLHFLLGSILNADSSDILFVLGMHRLLIGVARTFYINRLLTLPNDFRTGALDSYFLAPVNNKLYYCLSDFSVNEVLNIALGLVIVTLSLQQLDDINLPLAVLTLLISNLLLFFILLAITATAASRINPGPLNAIFTNIFSLSQFKPEFFPAPINSVLKFVFPIGLLIWGPLELIVTPNMESWILFIFFAVMTFFAQQLAWTKLVEKYSSAN